MRNLLFSFAMFSLALASGCAKEQVSPLPDVQAVAPMLVPTGATVVVTGAHFNTTPTANQLTFNGVPGTVSAATPTQLTVVVPIGAFSDELLSAEVYVTTEGKRSPTPFILTADRFPQVISIEPVTSTLAGCGL